MRLFLPYCFLIVVWFANINDLIRGTWFYPSIYGILFWNSMGILSLICIIIDYKSQLKKERK